MFRIILSKYLIPDIINIISEYRTYEFNKYDERLIKDDSNHIFNILIHENKLFMPQYNYDPEKSTEVLIYDMTTNKRILKNEIFLKLSSAICAYKNKIYISEKNEIRVYDKNLNFYEKFFNHYCEINNIDIYNNKIYYSDISGCLVTCDLDVYNSKVIISGRDPVIFSVYDNKLFVFNRFYHAILIYSLGYENELLEVKYLKYKQNMKTFSKLHEKMIVTNKFIIINLKNIYIFNRNYEFLYVIKSYKSSQFYATYIHDDFLYTIQGDKMITYEL